MEKLTQPKLRDIIDDFAKEISDKKSNLTHPAKTVINFRSWLKDGYEKEIYYIPIELLRFRKHNGRITSDLLSYEKNYGLLNETTNETQAILRGFLANKDPEKTDELRRSILQAGQTQPAIITCDGFLINGNRRKMVFEKLLEEYPGSADFKRMKVVILPGKDDKNEGGPPTLIEIEELENRYQLQKEGKAEYYGFDRALSIRRKEQMGMTLEQQLRDDPTFAGLDKRRFKKEVQKVRDELLNPLECVDKYLCHLGREGLYNTVATGLSDPQGRWQAFIDYHKSVYQKLVDHKKRISLGVEEDEVGNIEDIAFKIIRMREFPQLPKAHQIMRELPKWLKNKESKGELFKLVNINLGLAKEEAFDSNGKEKEPREQDKIWQVKNKEKFITSIKKAKNYYDFKEEKETPLKLLETALKKLNHENMQPTGVSIFQFKKAMKLAEAIAQRANELKSEFYNLHKKSEKTLQKIK